MGNRSVTSGRRVVFEFLDLENLRIGDWLRRQHWERFCSLDIPFDPNLVRNFFENMSLGYESIISKVKGTQIVITEDRLSRILGVPKEGKCYLTLDKKEDGLRTVLEKRSVSDLRSFQANQLSLEMRLLHNMVSRIFFLKIGRFDWVTERDIAFIHFLINGDQINLPFLMMSQIKEVAKRQRACLPYTIVFTLIFNEFGVDLNGESSNRLLHTDHYSEKSLHRMGYTKMDGVG